MNENLERLLPNPFATDYTGKIADERMVDLYTEKELEKFAELIIEECIRQIQNDIVRSGNTPENNRSYQHMEVIKQHFGIE